MAVTVDMGDNGKPKADALNTCCRHHNSLWMLVIAGTERLRDVPPAVLDVLTGSRIGLQYAAYRWS